jgi:CBS domain-containing protein
MRELSDIILNQDPLILPRTATVQAACRQMRDRHAGSVLVTDEDGRLAGIFTGRDAVSRVLAAGRSARTTTLGDAMTPAPKTLAAGKKAIDALRLMSEGGFRHVPVLDEGRIRGVVSRGDFRGEEHDRLEFEQELWEHMR